VRRRDRGGTGRHRRGVAPGPASPVRRPHPPHPKPGRRPHEAPSGRAAGLIATPPTGRGRGGPPRGHGSGPDRCARQVCPIGVTEGSRRAHGVGAQGPLSARKDVVTQALSVERPARAPRHVAERPPLLAVGVMIWLGSEVMFFSGLFAAYFTIRAHAATWPPLSGAKVDYVQAGIFSVVLLVSSPTFQLGVWAQERGERRNGVIWIVISFLLGAAFLANTLYEWSDFAGANHGPALNAYWSLFFIMTGVHGLHVALGLVAMIFLL